jgi:RND superfamily putative drug exporter
VAVAAGWRTPGRHRLTRTAAVDTARISDVGWGRHRLRALVVARYRENRSAGMDNDPALSAATASAGSAVLLAGGTVVVAMLALALTGMGFLASIGLATALIVLLAMATALTLLPALLSLLGDRVDAGRLGRRGARGARTQVHGGAWWRFAHHVAARPWRYLLTGTALLVTLAAPALDMRTGFPDAGHDTPGATHRQAYDLVAEGFGPGTNGPLLLVVDLSVPGARPGTWPGSQRRWRPTPASPR